MGMEAKGLKVSTSKTEVMVITKGVTETHIKKSSIDEPLLSPIQQTVAKMTDFRALLEDVTINQNSKLIDSIVSALVPVILPIISAEIKTFFEKLSDRMKDVEQKLVQLEVDQTVRLSSVEKENTLLKERIFTLEDDQDATRQYAMTNHLIIDRIPETERESTDELVIKACKRIKVSLDIKDIQRSHRLGPQTSGRTRPIIVHFVSSRLKNRIIHNVKDDLFAAISTARSQRQPTRGIQPKLFVREHLTKRRAAMLKDLVALKREGKVQSVWTEDGALVVRRNQGERLIRVHNERQFSSFVHS